MIEQIILAITGASGAIYGIQALNILKATGHQTHLIMSAAARQTIKQETAYTLQEITQLASFTYEPADIGAAIASGSYPVSGMLVAPCSIKTLSAIANSYTSDLIVRTADVCLKEGRPLVLMVREAPLHRGHLRLMTQAAEAGAVIFPPVPAFYNHPQTVIDIVNNSVGRALARLGIANDAFSKWEGDNHVSA